MLRDPFEQLQVTYYDPPTLDKRPTQVAWAVTDSEVGAVSSSICREQGRSYPLATAHRSVFSRAYPYPWIPYPSRESRGSHVEKHNSLCRRFSVSSGDEEEVCNGIE